MKAYTQTLSFNAHNKIKSQHLTNQTQTSSPSLFLKLSLICVISLAHPRN